MVDTEESLSAEQIRAKIAEAKRKRDEANIDRSDKARKAAESRQRKDKVNRRLIRGQGHERDEPWTFRARTDLIKQVKTLAKDLSAPKAKVSIASLMEEAMEMVLAHYREKAQEAEGDGAGGNP